MPLDIIGRDVPPAIKRAAREAWRARVLRRAVERLPRRWMEDAPLRVRLVDSPEGCYALVRRN